MTACTCKPTCDDICSGECGCIACQYEPLALQVINRCTECRTELKGTTIPKGKCCYREWLLTEWGE
jgi:hypothetical protein